MSIYDEFSKNFVELIELVYEKQAHDWPIAIRGSRKKSTPGGIYCRNGDALHKLREVERQLGQLNDEILRFFGIDEALLPRDGIKPGRARPRKVKR